MSISKGDIVMLVADCCEPKWIGAISEVYATSDVRDGECSVCSRKLPPERDAYVSIAGTAGWIPFSRLKKLRPPALPESITEHDHEHA
jgi:hypothetical protein